MRLSRIKMDRVCRAKDEAQEESRGYTVYVKKEILRSVFDPPFVSTTASGGGVSIII
jgi:hypothetical protein